MNIVEFVEARIAEDEATAGALLRDLKEQVAEEYAGVVDEKGPMTPARLLGAQMWAHYDGQSKRHSFAKGQQIAALANPARVLAECAAKRAIIAMYEQGDEAKGWDPEAYIASTVFDAMRALAAVYKDHPDYEQEWAA